MRPPAPHAAGGADDGGGIPQPTGGPARPDTGGPDVPGTTRARTPVSQLPEFAIEWSNTLRVSPVVTTGQTEAEAAAANRAEKPLLVYVYGDDRSGDEDPRYLVESHRAFQDDAVRVGARFFTCLRVHKLDAKRDKALRRYAHMAPCLVFLRPDYDAAKCLGGKWTARDIAAAMHLTLRKDFENCVHCTVEAQKTLQHEEAALLDAKQELARLAKGGDGRRREALAKRVAKAEEELAERRKELYALKPREA